MKNYKEIVGKYWDGERKFIEQSYQSIYFPFDSLPSKSFTIEVKWNINDLAGYFQSWSSVQYFINDRQFNPVEQFLSELTNAWTCEAATLRFELPVFMRIGRIIK